jgi:hypothetical protein
MVGGLGKVESKGIEVEKLKSRKRKVRDRHFGRAGGVQSLRVVAVISDQATRCDGTMFGSACSMGLSVFVRSSNEYYTNKKWTTWYLAASFPYVVSRHFVTSADT